MNIDSRLNNILIIGATSSIASEAARLFAVQKASLFLVGRDPAKLNAIADDVRVLGAEQVATFMLDINDLKRHTEMLEAAIQALGVIDAVLIAHGTLPDQRHCEADTNLTISEFTTNGLSTIALLIPVAQYFENRKRGCIAVITSVAGDRGRRSNYVYGSAKAAVDSFLQGLRNRLYGARVHVLTIKPGYVDTPMTADLPKNILFSKPQTIAKGIYKAMMRRKNDIIYLPWFWHIIMLIIKLIPERIFKRMSL